MTYRIDKLIIVNSSRLALGGKTKIEYTPKSPFQLIIGTNSSGKSSLLKELSPLPADFNDYLDGGYKEIHITCNHSVFIIKSTKGIGKPHSFIKDDVELNTSGGITLQRELILTHLNLTEEIHDLLIGEIRFTKMSVDERRKWITRMCPQNLDYANKILGNIKGQLRDTVGALRHNESRLIQATEKLLALENDNEDYIALSEDLNHRIEGLQRLQNNNVKPPSFEIKAIEALMSGMMKQADTISTKLYPSPPSWLPRNSDPRLVYMELNNLWVSADSERKMLLNKLSEHASLVERIKQSEKHLKDVLAERETTNVLLHEITHQLKDNLPGLTLDELTSDLSNLGKIDRVINEISAEYPLSHLLDIVGSLTKSSSIKETANTVKQKLTSAQASLENIAEMLNHASQSEHIECPKCQHGWNASNLNIDELETAYERFTLQVQRCNEWLANNEDAMVSAQQFQYVQDKLIWLSQSTGLIRRTPCINIEAIVSGELHADLAKLRSENLLHTRYLRARNTLADYDKSLAAAKTAHELTCDVLVGDAGGLEHRLVQLQDECEYFLNRRNDVVTYIENYDRYVEALKSLNIGFTKTNQSIIEVIDCTFNDVAQQYLSQYRSALGAIEYKKTIAETTRRNLETLQQDKADLKATEAALKELLTALSPKEGLIAEQLYGTIRTIVKDMNDFIDAIWTYDLIIQACPMENDELTYKFPLMVENVDTIRSDVSKGSSSVKDIVDCAFVRLAYKYFNLQGYPIFFDEFGATFDPEHVHKAMMFIQNEHALGNHSAIFMISHFENYYNNFQDADVNVLHTGNIRFEHKHNENLIIS